MQALVAVFVAGLSGLFAWLIARNNSQAAKRLEVEKREYTDAGRRRKLHLLLNRATRTTVQNIGIDGMCEPDSWKPLVDDLREYIMTAELASAIEDDARMDAVYDILESFEHGQSNAQAAVRSAKAFLEEYVQYVEETKTPGEDTWDTINTLTIWKDPIKNQMMALLIKMAETLRSYWFLSSQDDQSQLLSAAIEHGKSVIDRRHRIQAQNKANHELAQRIAFRRRQRDICARFRIKKVAVKMEAANISFLDIHQVRPLVSRKMIKRVHASRRAP